MAKKIFTKINMFDLNQQVFLADGEDIKLISTPTMAEMKGLIFSLLDSNTIQELEFDGNEKYIQAVGMDILEDLTKKYSNRNVRILINGKIFN